jgi:hypothetical protein
MASSRPAPAPRTLRFLDDQGYYVSNFGFKGPFLSSATLQAKKPVELKTINLFCVKKTLHDAVVKAYGAWPPKAAGGRRRALLGAGGSGGAAAAAASGWQREGSPAAAAAWASWFDGVGTGSA